MIFKSINAFVNICKCVIFNSDMLGHYSEVNWQIITDSY